MEDEGLLPTREFDRFDALGDDGRRHTVILVSRIFQFRMAGGASEEHVASARYQLLDGRVLAREGATTFRIADTAERLRRVA